MHPIQTDSLTAWLFPRVRAGVLARLMLDQREWHARDLARVLGLTHAAVAAGLRVMATLGIAIRRRSGNRVYYIANPTCPIYPELRSIIAKSAGLADLIRAALLPLAERIKAAYIYGSMANGASYPHSDVDLMVVGAVPLREVVEVLDEAEQACRREINATTYPIAEYQQKLRLGSGFIHEVHHGAVIMLLGDLHELE
jgi:uncharacterized protein